MADAHDPELKPLAEVYSAAAYGPSGTVSGDMSPIFRRADQSLKRRYQTASRLYGWLRPTSLRRLR